MVFYFHTLTLFTSLTLLILLTCPNHGNLWTFMVFTMSYPYRMHCIFLPRFSWTQIFFLPFLFRIYLYSLPRLSSRHFMQDSSKLQALEIFYCGDLIHFPSSSYSRLLFIFVSFVYLFLVPDFQSLHVYLYLILSSTFQSSSYFSNV